MNIFNIGFILQDSGNRMLDKSKIKSNRHNFKIIFTYFNRIYLVFFLRSAVNFCFSCFFLAHGILYLFVEKKIASYRVQLHVLFKWSLQRWMVIKIVRPSNVIWITLQKLHINIGSAVRGLRTKNTGLYLNMIFHSLLDITHSMCLFFIYRQEACWHFNIPSTQQFRVQLQQEKQHVYPCTARDQFYRIFQELKGKPQC